MNRKIWLPTATVIALTLISVAYYVGRETVTQSPQTRDTVAATKVAQTTVTPSDIPPTSVPQTSVVPPSSSASTSITTEPTVPAAVLATCSRVGGTPVEGQDNWYILGPTYLNPECNNVPYIGIDGMTYYDNFPLTTTGISSTDVYGNSTSSSLGGTAASQSECSTGHYPQANPGVDAPGVWNSQLDLCLP
jgi:hypothetical protein